MSVKPGLYIVPLPCKTPVWVAVVPSHEREALEAAPTSRVTLKAESPEAEASPSSEEQATRAKTA